jgi:hypothetical protein
MKITVFWNLLSPSPILKMEAARSSEVSVVIYYTLRHHIKNTILFILFTGRWLTDFRDGMYNISLNFPSCLYYQQYECGDRDNLEGGTNLIILQCNLLNVVYRVVEKAVGISEFNLFLNTEHNSGIFNFFNI